MLLALKNLFKISEKVLLAVCKAARGLPFMRSCFFLKIVIHKQAQELVCVYISTTLNPHLWGLLWTDLFRQLIGNKNAF